MVKPFLGGKGRGNTLSAGELAARQQLTQNLIPTKLLLPMLNLLYSKKDQRNSNSSFN